MSIPVVSVVGKSDSGKTTLLEGLIHELKQRGYRVGTIKHDAHSFDIDHPGTDTWRHARAGSDHVVISSPRRVASIHRVDHDHRLKDLTPMMADVDIVLTEGYRRDNAPKIEVSRQARSRTLLCSSDELLAVVCDHPVATDVPRYELDDAQGLADLIEAHFLAGPPAPPDEQ